MKKISFILLFFLHLILSVAAQDISKTWDLDYGKGKREKIDLPFLRNGDIKKIKLTKKLIIENIEENKVIMLGSIDDVDKVYLNDKLIGKKEIDKIDEKHYKSYYDLERIYFIPKGYLHSGENKIEIFIENYIGDYGIKGDKFLLLSEDEFFKKELYEYKTRIKSKYLLYLIFCGVFLMSGIKHFLDYIFFRVEKEDFYVSVLLLLFSVYTFWRIPGRDYILNLSSYMFLKIDFLTAIAIVICIQLFIQDFFKIKRSRILLLYFYFNILILFLISFNSNLKLIYLMFGIWNLILVSQLLLYIVVIFRKKKDFKVNVISFGLVVLFLTTVYDILFFWRILDFFKRAILMYGYFVFAITVLIVKTKDYYTMRLKLKKSNIFLEKQMEEKTAELKDSNLMLELTNAQLKSSLEDIKMKEEQLIRSEKLASLGEFAGEITHEIKNPLGAIMTNTQLLLLDLKDFDQEDEKIIDMIDSAEIVEAASKQAKGIITNILNYSRIDKGNFKEVDIMHIIESVELLVKKDLNKMGIKLQVLECSDFKVIGKSGELTQVLLNLIVNARDAVMEKDSEEKVIIIRCKCERGISILEIEDNGIGMSPEEQDNVFKPFFTTKEEGHGTGLGMSVTYAILERHNCDVKIYSKKNRGSKFVLSFKENTD